MTERYKIKEEAINDIGIALNELFTVVSSTMGPGGSNVIIPDDMEQGKYKVTMDGVSVAKSFNTDNKFHKVVVSLIKQVAEETVKDAGDGPQPITSKILTPSGWTTMGEIKVGDIICGTNGSIQTVEEVFDKGFKEVVKVNFSNGRTVECCEDHLWNVTKVGGSKVTLTTREMMNKGVLRYQKNRKISNFYTPKALAQFEEKELPLHPYLLGVILGDGSISGTGSVELSIGFNKKHIISKLYELLPSNIMPIITEVKEKNYFRIRFSSIEGVSIKDILEEIGVYGTRSTTKFIPKNYLYNSIDNRKELLNGLLDTDGHINVRGLFEFSTISDRLKDDFIELVRSLGLSIGYRLKTRGGNSNSYSNKPIHTIAQLKGYKYGDRIDSIVKESDDKVHMKCIKVSNPDNLYITDDYIVTHNTTTSIVLLKSFYDNLKRYKYKEYDKTIKELIEQLEKQSVKIGIEGIHNVCKVSANGDELISRTISSAFKTVNTVVSVKQGYTSEDIVITEKGYMFPETLCKPYLMDNKILSNIDINEESLFLAVNYKLDVGVLNNISDIITKSIRENKMLLIVAPEISDTAKSIIDKNTNNVLVVKTPGYSDHRENLLKDIAKYCGSEVLTIFDNKLKACHVGVIKGFKIDDKNTVLKNDLDLTDYINELTAKDKNVEEHESDLLKQRISRLKGDNAIIFVGGNSEAERIERFDRFEDAVLAVNCALEEGVVKGGGVALLDAYDNIKNKNEDIIKSIFLPYMIISKDSSLYDRDTLNKDIVDPLKVTKTALIKSYEFAKMLLNTESIILSRYE